MEKIICPAGTKQSLYEIFTDLQNSTDTNLKRRFDRFISSYGIVATVKNGVITSDEFKINKSGLTNLTIEKGSAITNSFNYIKSISQTTTSLNTIASGIYTILAKAKPYTDAPVNIVNGFLYNQAGADTVDTRNMLVLFLRLSIMEHLQLYQAYIWPTLIETVLIVLLSLIDVLKISLL